MLLCGLGLVVVLLGSTIPQYLMGESAAAPEAAPAPVANEEAPPTISGMFGKLFAGTLVIVVLGCAASWAFAKKNRKVPPKDPNQPMELLGKLPVGRGMVYYVRIKNHRVIAAVDNTGFKSITQVNTLPIPETPPGPVAYTPQPAPTFLQVLNGTQGNG